MHHRPTRLDIAWSVRSRAGRPFTRQTRIRVCMLAFGLLTVVSGSIVGAQVLRQPVAETTTATTGSQAQHQPLTQDTAVQIPLMVFLTSLVATAALTWKVAKYDSKRDQELTALRVELEQVKTTIKTQIQTPHTSSRQSTPQSTPSRTTLAGDLP